jgi:type III pantothenate kinase
MDLQQIPHVLACDVGNSGVHMAHVQGEQVDEVVILRTGELASLGEKLADLWARMPAPRKLVACSVSPASLKALEAAADEAIHEPVLVVGRDIPLPVEARVDEPSRVGADRLCTAVAAFDRLGVGCVVADFGTAITIDAISDEGVFLGGAILPGLNMGADALHNATAQLPRVAIGQCDWVFGKNTTQAIVGGLVCGARGALRYFVEAYATEMGHWPLVVLTGGDAALVADDPSTAELVQAVVPDLAIRGTAIAYYRTLLPK